MNGLKKLIANLTLRQRATIAVVTVLVITSLVYISRWNRERDFKPIYTGLAAEDAGAVIARLHENGVEYRLAENGSSILVPSSKVAEVRLQLAAAGLPKSGRIGFELFDKANFGTTDFAEQVNYHRAIEGELERSVMCLAEVEQARVHVTFPKESIFAESREPAKASVLLKLRMGAQISPQNVQAISHLVASAVEGLDPDSVSVLDMRGNLLSHPRRKLADGTEPDEATIEFRQKIERDLLAKINATLDPLLGADKFRAGVSVDCDFTSGEQSEENFDPSKSVMVSAQRTEDSSNGNGTSGIPGTASALPRPAPRAAPTAAGVSRRSENITYETSRVVRRLRLPEGNVKRISISLLVDHMVRWEGSGAAARRVVEPPSAERLKAIHDLLAATVGLDPQRGDQLIVESLPFESTLAWEPPPAPGLRKPAPGTAPSWNLLEERNVLVALGIGLAAVLALGLIVFRVFLAWRRRERSGMTADGERALPPSSAESTADLEKQLEAKLAEQTAARDRAELEAISALRLPAPTTKKAEVLSKHLTAEAKKDPAVMAQLLRTWIAEGDR